MHRGIHIRSTNGKSLTKYYILTKIYITELISNLSIDSVHLQLVLKSKTTTPLSIHFFAMKGPFYDMKVKTQIYKHDFTDQVIYSIDVDRLHMHKDRNQLSFYFCLN